MWLVEGSGSYALRSSHFLDAIHIIWKNRTCGGIANMDSCTKLRLSYRTEFTILILHNRFLLDWRYHCSAYGLF
jgi:hypothetical protein